MRIQEFEQRLGYRLIQGRFEDQEIADGYTSDLLSDVMANASADSVLITIQAHKNTVAVATLAGIRAILLCNSRPIPEDMIEAAKTEGIAIFSTDENQYTASARIYACLHSS